MEKQLKPAIRFKGFTDPWEQRKLGEILKTLSFKPYLKTPEKDGKYEVVQQGYDPIIGFANGEPCRDYKDTVVFGDHTLSLYKPTGPFFIATDGVRILQGIDKMDGNYLLVLLEQSRPKPEGYKRYYSILADREAIITSNHDEQAQIGSCFEKLDNLITLHQRKYDKLQVLKKAMLEKMFPQNGSNVPEIRFRGFTDPWEQCKLGDIVKLNGRIGFRGYTEKDIISKEAGGILTFSPTNIVDNKLTTDCKNTYITRYKYDESPEIQVHNGDILFVKTGSTLGKSALITGLSEEATLNPQVVVMRVNSGKEEFLLTALITDNILKQVNSSKIGGAVPTLTETKIKEFSISLPTSDEEKKQIGDYFRNLDNLITLHQRELEKLQKIKKAMLEKMFV